MSIFWGFATCLVIYGSKWKVFKLSAGQIEDATLGSVKLWWMLCKNLDIRQQISATLIKCGDNLQIKMYYIDEKSSQIRK